MASEDVDKSDIISEDSIPCKPLLVTIWVLFAVTFIILLCRLAIRLSLHRRLFLDDLFATSAFILLLVQDILITVLAPDAYMWLDVMRGSIPPPVDYVSRGDNMIKLIYATNIIYNTTLYTVKASVLALLFRVIRDLSNFRKAWWVIVSFTGFAYLSGMILVPVSCTDLHAGGCIEKVDIERDLKTLRYSSAVNIASDLLIMSLPFSFTLSSRLPPLQKVGLIGLFSLGFGVIALCAVRLVSTNNENKHPSITWLVFWGACESSVAVMMSCFAAFKSICTIWRRRYSYANSAQGEERFSWRPMENVDAILHFETPLADNSEMTLPKRDMIVPRIETTSRYRDDSDLSDSREQIPLGTEGEIQSPKACKVAGRKKS